MKFWAEPPASALLRHWQGQNRQSMNILIYCDDPGTGGTAVNAALLASGLALAGHTMVLACGHPANPYVLPGVFCEPLCCDLYRFPLKSRFSRHEPEELFARHRPDLVFFCDSAPDSSLAAKAVCLAWHIPFVVLVNYVSPTVPADLADRLPEVAAAYAAALAVVAVSTDNLALLRTWCGAPGKRSGVIANGRPEHFFRPVPARRRAGLRRALGLGTEDVLCVTVGRYEPRKGYLLLLEVVGVLARSLEGRHLRYAWIGPDPTGFGQILTREVARRGLGAHVLVAGPRDDVGDWLAAADIFALPSYSEGMPLSIIEAMAQGLPVVATAVSGIPEQLGGTGVLVPDPACHSPAVAGALTLALAALAADPVRRQTLGQAARQRALALYTDTVMLGAYRRLFASLTPVVALYPARYPVMPFCPANGVGLVLEIPLGDDTQAVEFLGQGWSFGEGGGRWTEGGRASLVVALPQGSGDAYRLECQVKPFIPPKGKQLTLRLSLCGQELGCWSWPPLTDGLYTLALAVFPEILRPGPGELVFAIDGASSPLSQGMSNDTRQLGLWVKRVRWDRLSRPAQEESRQGSLWPESQQSPDPGGQSRSGCGQDGKDRGHVTKRKK